MMVWFIWAIALSLTLTVGIAIGNGRSVTAAVKDYALWFIIILGDIKQLDNSFKKLGS